MCQQPSLTNTPHISLVQRRVTAPERAFWKPAAHSIDLGPRGCQHPIEQLFLQTVHVSLACLTLISIIYNERDLRSNFWCLVLAISVTSLLLQNTLWFKQKFVGVMLSICLTWEARGMNRTVSSCLSSNKDTKACINYNILLHHREIMDYARKILGQLRPSAHLSSCRHVSIVWLRWSCFMTCTEITFLCWQVMSLMWQWCYSCQQVWYHIGMVINVKGGRKKAALRNVSRKDNLSSSCK